MSEQQYDGASTALDGLARLWAGYGQYLTGLGAYVAAEGDFAAKAAWAAARDAETFTRLNQYAYECRKEQERRFGLAQQRRRSRVEAYDRARAIERARLLETPTAADVEAGRALNALLAFYTEPAVVGAVDALTAPFPIGQLARIPLDFLACGPIRACFGGLLAARWEWPEVLQGGDYAAAYREFQDALFLLLVRNRTGAVPADLLDRAGHALRTMMARLGLEAQTPEVVGARWFLIGLAGLLSVARAGFDPVPVLTRALEAEAGPEPTVGDLLAFLDLRAIRFGRAETPDARQLYRSLFEYLDTARRELIGELES